MLAGIAGLVLAGLPAGGAALAGSDDASGCAASAPAGTASAPAPGEQAAPELGMFAEMPVVISAARVAQPINLLSVPVSVVTADDIHYGGWTSLPDILQFVPGVNVLPVDRNNASVGVHGMEYALADRTLVLIDGRNAANPTGTTDFNSLPLFPEDIARIEVVQGPGGAAWGANAFNGVINIITKNPEEVQGVLASSTFDTFGDSFSQVRWGAAVDQWSWRISAGYDGQRSSSDAISDADFSSNDFCRDWLFDGEAAYRPDTDTRISFGAGMAQATRGAMEFGGVPSPADPALNEDVQHLLYHGRIDHDFTPDTSGYLQLSGQYQYENRPSLDYEQSYENDLESQINLSADPANKLTIGGNLRWDEIVARQVDPTDLFPNDTNDEYWTGLFVMDRWQVTRRLAVEGQVRGDWYSETGADWSGRLSGLYSLDRDSQHVLRLSLAKAFRAPMYVLRAAEGERVPLPPPAPPGLYGLELIAPDDLKNEETWSLEAGYHGQICQGLTADVNGRYQHYDRLIGGQTLPDPLGLGRWLVQLQNINGADAYGADTQLTYTRKMLQATVWYTYDRFVDAQANQSIRAFEPAPDSVGVTGRVFLPCDFTLNAAYRWTDVTQNDAAETLVPVISPHHELDLTLTKKVAHGHGELQIGVSDVLNTTRSPSPILGQIVSQETPGRTFFARVQIRF
jgi:iron complex outermembrane receptor protein